MTMWQLPIPMRPKDRQEQVEQVEVFVHCNEGKHMPRRTTGSLSKRAFERI